MGILLKNLVKADETACACSNISICPAFGKISISAKKELELKTDKGSITLNPSGITIDAKGGNIVLRGKLIRLN